MLRVFLQKIQKGLSGFTKVPKNTMLDTVRKGHFTVFAVKGDETQRFEVQIGYLAEPAFLRLLKQAEDEYGFRQKGALAVPCRPEELRQVLEEKNGGGGSWACLHRKDD